MHIMLEKRWWHGQKGQFGGPKYYSVLKPINHFTRTYTFLYIYIFRFDVINIIVSNNLWDPHLNAKAEKIGVDLLFLAQILK